MGKIVRKTTEQIQREAATGVHSILPLPEEEDINLDDIPALSEEQLAALVTRDAMIGVIPVTLDQEVGQ